MSYKFKSVLLASVALLLYVAGGRNGTSAQTDTFANHHKELQFTLPPGQSASFPLPSKNHPVQILVSTSSVTTSFNGSIIPVGPLLGNALVSVDSGAGLANIDTPVCTGQDTCTLNVSFFNVRDPNNFMIAGAVLMFMTVDRHSGNISLGLQGTTGPTAPVLITNNEINYTVVMTY